MASTPAPKRPAPRSARAPARERDGIALFMVIAAMSVLSILVTEFTYVAQTSQAIAFDALDQLKAHYLAKSGLKLSLLRLKAFEAIKTSPLAKAAGAQVPAQIFDKIWDFPFLYPIPTDLPGLGLAERDYIAKFQKDSGLEGNFSALIESESSRYNLNSILPAFANPSPSPSGSSSPAPGASPAATAPAAPQPNPSTSFSPEDARKNLYQFLSNLVTSRSQADPQFAQEYRDLQLQDLTDNITAWADPTFQLRNPPRNEDATLKHAPFSSLTELHMIPLMDDQLYDLFAPALTVTPTQGINLNKMQASMVHALAPSLTDQEVTDLLKYRDDPDKDQSFKSSDDFFNYLRDYSQTFGKRQDLIDQLKSDLQKRGISLITDENQFKITVQAHVNQSVRTIEAWVTLGPANGGPAPGASPTPSSSPNPAAPPGAVAAPGADPRPDPGLRITFMRVW